MFPRGVETGCMLTPPYPLESPFWRKGQKSSLRFDKTILGVKMEPWLKSGRIKMHSAVLDQTLSATLHDSRLAIAISNVFVFLISTKKPLKNSNPPRDK